MNEEGANRLIGEKSPYLLKHAHNPVDWYAWNPESLAKAKNDGKPVFLSIGYFSCHWCTVMERESFEDKETAGLLNRYFIPIKVDREERPDIDAYYMSAVQAMTGGGGWPLSVFLTPDLKPFYGGTYFPPEPRSGMPSFRQVLEFVARIWKDNRKELLENSQRIAQVALAGRPVGGEPTAQLLDGARSALVAGFDAAHGGFGGAPKFPLPIHLEFLLRQHYRSGDTLALKVVTKTLDEMARGGIRDHVGGGFHRYSTDRYWLVPHFEKMLYDNALLARLYARAFLVTRNEAHAAAARETLDWMLKELADPDGAFYSALDADTEDGEGVYYTWTPEEVRSVLGEEWEEFCHLYRVTAGGNFGGRSILTTSHGLDETGSSRHMDNATMRRKVGSWRDALYRARLGRPRPAVDTKVISSWNGLAISALAVAGRALGELGYLGAARKTARAVLAKSLKGDTLLRSYAGGEASIPGMLEDYAFMADGLADLFEATGEPEWLERSLALARKMDDLWDAGEGGFFMGTESVPAKLKDDHDGPTPAGNSVAASIMLRLFELTGDRKMRERAELTVKRFARAMEEEPTDHTQMLSALDAMLNGMREVVITADTMGMAAPMVARMNGIYLPDAVMVVSTRESAKKLSSLTPLLEGREPGAEPLAFVCENFTCKLPARTPDELAGQLAPARK